MSENTTTPEAAEFDLLDWIDSGTTARWEHPIYNNPALASVMEDLKRQYDEATRADENAPAGEESMGETSRVNHLLREMERVVEQWEASKAVWRGHALAQELIDEITEKHPLPEARPEPQRHQYSSEEAYAAAYEKWLPHRDAVAKKIAVAMDERNYRFIVASVDEVVTPKGSVTGVSLEQVRRIAVRPHGKKQLTALVQKISQATNGDVEVVAPKGLPTS
ncbi:hypothetical protein [Ruania rhizosphaerae]|uniref:hypothetical protein n=1 Tax=Ruania rhizosphaerae TaxID=1840413 RepID=UPI00135A03E2|nr:hypothetical protein [Ruania rhizosphaerae]